LTAGGRTIREAIGVALEGLSGDVLEYVVFAKQRDAMRHHVLRFVHEYARNRGVILTDKDITDELACVVAELKSGKPLGVAARG
jgi:hypothetical protein